MAILLVPIPYLASPEWSVTVTDEAGHPLSGMLVRLNYENYSVENNGHEIDLYTNASGRVAFPARRRFALTLSRCYYTALSASALAHASFGPSAYVDAFGPGLEGSAMSNGAIYFWKGDPDKVNTTIISKPIRQ